MYFILYISNFILTLIRMVIKRITIFDKDVKYWNPALLIGCSVGVVAVENSL